eukprot:TRINITY_DN14678_c0_g1_i1.p1 TRINITY_DN14678_c0_g1~~TRINITY_DN14678_c0_g1_i1.p1  ORF type:complete len:392 (-),score=125.11 TRINITY_DN14678_c0_g1_i1:48-1223(-)
MSRSPPVSQKQEAPAMAGKGDLIVQEDGSRMRLSNTLYSNDSTFGKSLTESAKNFGHAKHQKFLTLLDCPNVDLDALRQLAWKGVPCEVRAMVWKLLLEYLPTNRDRRAATLERKRAEYADCIPQYFDVNEDVRTPDEKALHRQIQVDMPRTAPTLPLFQSTAVQQRLARLLYVWAIRHPASGYVQGINDLATPFFVVFLSEHVAGDVHTCDVSQLGDDVMLRVEADTYWCLTKMLDGIQDHYTFSQPGLQRMIHKLTEITQKIDPALYEHFENQQIMFIQFAFRWMNCLLMRELPLPLIIRVWDTYFSELETLGLFHVYTCAAFLKEFSGTLLKMDFQEMMLFLNNVHTGAWDEDQIELLLSQAYVWIKNPNTLSPAVRSLSTSKDALKV